MDLVVIEKKNAMAVFTNNDQLDPLIEAIEKEARSLVPVFPAPAGINRLAILFVRYSEGVPRASGDKPIDQASADRLLKCSPRQRG